MRFAATILLVAIALLIPCAAEPATTTPVGLHAQLRDLILPGSELEAAPLEPGSPVVLRILTARIHGDAFRYDIDYYGLEPGLIDLAPFLQRKDGSDIGDDVTIPVQFEAILDPQRILPNEPSPSATPPVGGYTPLLILAGVLWLGVLLALIFLRRGKTTTAEQINTPPPTYADRLRPLVEAARDGELDKGGQADLERTLLGFWREKLDLADESPATALAKLRQNAESAPLLEQLESWLHSPAPDSPSDIEALLAPYRDTTAKR